MTTNAEVIEIQGPLSTAALAQVKPEEWCEAIISRIPAFAPEHPGLLSTTKTITVIADDSEYGLALTYAADLQAEHKAVEAHFKPYNQALNELRTRGVALRDGQLSPLKAEVDRLKRLAMDYDAEKARKAREEEARRVREAQEKAEREKRELEEKAQREAEQLAAEGKLKEADAVIEQAALDVQDVRPEPIIVPVVSMPAAVSGTSRRKTYKAEYGNLLDLVLAAAKNPEAYLPYLAFNEKSINAAVKAQGESCRIPGVTVREEAGLAIRASR